MAGLTKIATCCYCGTRAALVLSGQERHELACSKCGAPLHEMKMLRRDHVASDKVPGPIRSAKPSKRRDGTNAVRRSVPRHEDLDPGPVSGPNKRAKPCKSRKRNAPKRRKGFMARVFEEAFDVIEDIFD